MSLLQTLVALADLGVDLRGYGEKELLYHAQQANPYSVTTGTHNGQPFATTRRSMPEWTDKHGVAHPALDRSAHYVYGETEAHATASLLLQQIQVHGHSLHALQWKKNAALRGNV